MAGISRKSRPNEVGIALSDGVSHGLFNTNRTQSGYARTSARTRPPGWQRRSVV